MKCLKCIVLLVAFFCSFNEIKAEENVFDVKVSGQGHPVLLFPGFTCTGNVWDTLLVELSKTHECHVFTFAGFGDVPAIETPWLPKIKDGVQAYIQKNELEEATLIGHSLGGTLALWLASEPNVSFNKLIVVDALPSTGALMIPNYSSEAIAYDTPYNQMMLDMDSEAFKTMAAQMAAGMSLNKDKHQQLIDWMINSDRKTYVYGFTDLLKLDLRETIAKIEIPVVILAATKPYGLEMVMNTYQEQYKLMNEYKILYAENSAHFVMFDQPEWFLKQVQQALN